MNASLGVAQLRRSRRPDGDFVKVSKYCSACNITQPPSVDGYYKQLKTGVDTSRVEHIVEFSGHDSAFLFDDHIGSSGVGLVIRSNVGHVAEIMAKVEVQNLGGVDSMIGS